MEFILSDLITGQLGLGHNKNVSLPTPISNLPKITQISCGLHFTDFLWSLGKIFLANWQQETKQISMFPQKIEDIPPVLSVACGSYHTLIITTYSNLWSCGNNEYGQLCLGNEENQFTRHLKKHPFQTSQKYLLVATIHYSKTTMEKWGECGLGHFNSPQITPSLILNLLSNIVEFVCGCSQNLFLDSEGNVFSVGQNYLGLGLGYNRNQNVLNKIPNIPPIKIISCVNVIQNGYNG